MDSKEKVEAKIASKVAHESKANVPPANVVVSNPAPSKAPAPVDKADLRGLESDKSKEPLVSVPKADAKDLQVKPGGKDLTLEDVIGKMSYQDKLKYGLAEEGDKPPVAAEPQFDDPHGKTLRDDHSQGGGNADNAGFAPTGGEKLPDGTLNLIPLQDAEIEAKKEDKTFNVQAQPRLTKYRVSLPDNPTVLLKATDPYDAIRVYKKAMGIVHTIHDFVINPG